MILASSLLRKMAFLSIVLLAAPAMGASDAPYGPKAMLPEPHFTFDEVLEGDTVTHVFPIRNTGTAELKIEKVRTG